MGAILLLGLALRLHGIHNPILDHPGWRQGDTAAIARNFATLDFNPFHPQTDYDGPPPNYVELELQIVPFLAATLYKIFGIHEIFGRLISIAFGLGTIAVVGAYARYAFGTRLAGAVAALAFAIYPGTVYYSRTFMPDTTMTFFLTAAVYAAARWIDDADGPRFGRRFWLAASLAAAALLAKPVAVVGLVPVVAMLLARRGALGTLASPATYAYAAVALIPYAAYDAYVRAIAEWHWASGITRLHVVPSLVAALESSAAFVAKAHAFSGANHMLATTMLGPIGYTAFAIGALRARPRPRARRVLRLARRRGRIRIRRRHRRARRLLSLSDRAARGAFYRRARANVARLLSGAPSRDRGRFARRRRRRRHAPERPRADRGVLSLQQDGVPSGEGARRHAAARARRHGTLRPIRAVLHRSQGVGGRPIPLDAVRRAERDPERGARVRRN